MENVFKFDLLKAMDKTKLVQVERTVTNTKTGHTFQRKYWVSPSEVTKTDNIIGNKQLWLDWRQQIKHPPKKGDFVPAFFEANKNRRDKAMKYLQDCGIVWAANPDPAINWMRACMAFTKECKARGLATNATTAVTLKPQAQKSSPNSTTSATAAPVATPVNSPTPTPAPATQANTSLLDAKQQAELDAGKNGKEKVVILKKLLGKNGCMDYASSLGVTWDTHTHPAINNMRMSVALEKYFDAKDGTTSPVKTKADKTVPSADGKVGAPKGNQNARKDQIAIDPNMSQREKNLVDLINNIDNEADLRNCIKMGIVGEDADAMKFITDQLCGGWKNGKAYDPDAAKKVKVTYDVTPKSFNTDAEKLNAFNSIHTNKDRYYDNDYTTRFTELMSKAIPGLSKKVLNSSDAGKTLLNSIEPSSILFPRNCMYAGGFNQGNQLYGKIVSDMGLMPSFNSLVDSSYYFDARFTFVPELDEIPDNIKADVRNLDTLVSMDLWSAPKSYRDWYIEKYGIDSLGFCQVLNKIKEESPEVSATVDKMKAQYKEILELSNYNIGIISAANSSSDSSYGSATSYAADNEATKQNLDSELSKISPLIDILKREYSLSEDDVFYTFVLCGAEYWDSGRKIYKNGEPISDSTTGRDVLFRDVLDKHPELSYTVKTTHTTQDADGDYISELVDGSQRNPGNSGTLSYGRFYGLAAACVACSNGESLTPESIKAIASDPNLSDKVNKAVEEFKMRNSSISTSWRFGSSGPISSAEEFIKVAHQVESPEDSKISKQDFIKLRSKLLEFSGLEVHRKAMAPDGTCVGIGTDKIDITGIQSIKEFNSEVGGGWNSNRDPIENDRVSLIIQPTEDENLDVVMAALNSLHHQYIANEAIASNVASSPNSKANKDGSDYTANFQFWSNNSLYHHERTKITPAYTRNGDNAVSLKDAKANCKAQLKSMKSLTHSDFMAIKSYVESNGFTEGFNDCAANSSWSGRRDLHDSMRPKLDSITKAISCSPAAQTCIEASKDTPIQSILTKYLQTTVLAAPQSRTKTLNTDEKVVDAIPDKFGFGVPKAEKQKSDKPKNLKPLRSQLFSVAKCSIKTCDKTTEDNLTSSIHKNWDKGIKSNPNGPSLYSHISFSMNKAYEIKNSEQATKFDEMIKSTGKAVTHDVYHSTDFNGAGGILGRTGGWIIDATTSMKEISKTAGKMLGPGAYFADLAGKSAGYFSNWGGGYGNRGAMLVCDVAMGNTFTVDGTRGHTRSDIPPMSDPNTDSVYMDKGVNINGGFGRTLRAPEFCIRSNDNIAPRYIIDGNCNNRR